MKSVNKIMAKRPLAIATAALLPGLYGATAMAQDLVLEEIIVTAQKKSESVQDIPATVNAISGDTLDNFQVFSFNEVAELTPGLELNTTDARNSTITLRGVNVDPDNTAQAPVIIYWNQVPIRPQVAFQPTYDLERMEVLRGPQGTLQGRTAPGGQINIYTRKANVSEYDGYVRQTFSDNATSNTQFGASIPVIEDKLAFRISGLYDDSELQQSKNLTNGQESRRINKAGRLTMDWIPTDSLEISLVYDYRENDSTNPITVSGDFSGTAVGRDIEPKDRYALSYWPDSQKDRQQLAGMEIDWDWGSHTFTSITGYQNNFSDNVQDRNRTNAGPGGPGTGGAAFTAPQNVTSQFYQFDQEFRIANNDGDLWEYLVGVYYSKSNSSTTAVNRAPFTLIAPGPTFANITATSDIPIIAELTAVFMHNQFNITDNQNIQFGLRYQHNSYRPSAEITQELNIIPAGQVTRFSPNVLPSTSEGAWTGSLKYSYFFETDMMVYASYDRGYRQPGVTITPTAADLPPEAIATLLPYDEETSDAIEIGFKSTLADGTFRLNGNIFYQDYKGYQARVTDVFYADSGSILPPVGVSQIRGGLTYNADAIIQGAELEFTHLATERFTWGGGVTYTDSRFKSGETGPCNDPTQPLAGQPDGTVNTCDIGGNLIAPIPYWSATLNGDYYVPVGSTEWYLRGLFTYRTKAVDENVPGQQISDYGIINLYTGFRAADGAWDVSLWAKNLMDSTHQSQLFNDARTPTIPQRTIGATFQYNWGI